jgi:lysophospholipase L1-like esterase
MISLTAARRNAAGLGFRAEFVMKRRMKKLRSFGLILGLVFAVRAVADDFPLAKAEECHARGGLPNFFAKAAGSGDVRVGYLGGSITAQDGWRPKTLAWFKKNFPTAKFSEINAAIGGTGSDLGVFRLQHDVLDQKPDLLLVEFAVNDGGASPERIHQAMEGIVRQTWKADPNTDICFVYTLAQNQLADLDKGFFQRSASAMEVLAEHYAIPTIHMGVEVAKLAREGKLTFKGEKPKDWKPADSPLLFSTDGVHPIPETGHELYLQAIVRSMEPIRAASGKPAPHKLETPLRADNWENAKMIPLRQEMLSGKWEKLDPTKGIAKNFNKRMGDVWKACEPGATLSFSFNGTFAAIYDVMGPDGGIVGIKVDDHPEKNATRIDGYCVYSRIQKLDVGTVPAGAHHVAITLKPDAPDKKKIIFEKDRGDLEKNPAKYKDNVWYASSIFLLGDLAADAK